MFRTILLLIGGMLISLAAQALPAAMELDASFIVFVALELSRLTGLLHVITLFQEYYLLILMSLPKQLPYFVVPLRLVFWGALLSILLNH